MLKRGPQLVQLIRGWWKRRSVGVVSSRRLVGAGGGVDGYAGIGGSGRAIGAGSDNEVGFGGQGRYVSIAVNRSICAKGGEFGFYGEGELAEGKGEPWAFDLDGRDCRYERSR